MKCDKIKLIKFKEDGFMYKLSVPISLKSINDDSMKIFLRDFKACGVERVFICGLGYIFDQNDYFYSHADVLQSAINTFRKNGYEVGVWISAFGHGAALSYMEDGFSGKYTDIEGIGGDKRSHAFCPLDENFRHDYAEGIKHIARMHPDIIMLDDDFRLNTRGYYFGCFCKKHVAEYYRRLGEEIPRSELERLMFTGGKNKYRSEWMRLSSDTLMDFAKMLRAEVDKIYPDIRLGACTTGENWDLTANAIEVAKAFAGNDTLPFTRTAGAPYWSPMVSDAIEDTRMQVEWCRGTGVEVFAEGDTYPRPRYIVPARRLEAFDLALIADGTADGDLKYMYEYLNKPENERGYVQRHIKNEKLREDINSLFDGKTAVGVRSLNIMRRIENMIMPDTIEIVQPATKLAQYVRSASRLLLSRNGIPTSYTSGGDYPIFLYGENARYVTADDLKNGAILDIPAAKALADMGIDTGLISEEAANFTGERFPNADDSVMGLGGIALKRIACSDKANVLSTFIPDGTPSAYTYQNGSGQRFLVIAHDGYRSCLSGSANFYNSYYRQEQLISAIEWLGDKKLPAVCPKAPYLYLLTSVGGGAMSVALVNSYEDDVIDPVVQLDRKYSEIKLVGCEGRLDGDKVYLSDIAPYGFAAFEVK